MRITRQRRVDEWHEFVVADLHPNGAEHTVLIPQAAIEDRRRVYGLEADSDDEVIDHLLAEHFVRLNPARMGELDDEVLARVARLDPRVKTAREQGLRGKPSGQGGKVTR